MRRQNTVRLEKTLSSTDPDLNTLSHMLDESFALTMEGCPDDVKDIPLPRGDDLPSGLQDGSELWKIFSGETLVGGALISIRSDGVGQLELLFILGNQEGRGIGTQAWRAIENAYPNVRAWDTITPCFQKRNVHFYVNKCGFHIVAYHNEWNPIIENGATLPYEMFVFRKEL